MTEKATVSLGIAAAVGPELAASIASAAEIAGFHALWVNDVPGADALAVLASAARVTDRLMLATGVIPVDRRPARNIVADVRAAGLDQSRLILGIGAGQTRSGGLRLVREAATELRDAFSSPVLVGALGPRMHRLAVDEADGVLLSWLTPAVARAQAAEAHRITPATRVALYMRTVLETSAVPRLRREVARYAALPPYAANFAREAIGPDETVLDAATRPTAEPLAAYRDGVDEVVLRAVTPDDTVGDYLRFIEAAQRMILLTAP